MDLRRLGKKISSNWRVLLIILVSAMMLYSLVMMLSPSSVITHDGRADLSGIDFSHNKLVSLDGQWEFYWNKLLMPEDYNSGQKVKMDSFMKVPGVWASNAGTHYTTQGIATYRLSLYYPSTLIDPALRIQYVVGAYKLYVNGRLVEEVGSSLNDKVNFKSDDKIAIIDLPKDTQKIDLVFQVGNLNCASGGLRAAPVFGSKQVLEQQRTIMLTLQLIFIGGVLIFGIHYFFCFSSRQKTRQPYFIPFFVL